MSKVAYLSALALAACSPVTVEPKADGTVRLGETVYVDGPRVTPLKVLEDSRCPTDVDCVWPGQVKLRVRIEGGSKTFERELSSMTPITVFDGQLSLTGVDPIRKKTGPIPESEYRFRFSFAGGI